MEPIFALTPDQFRAALAELGLDAEREADLIRQYNEINGPQEGAGRRGMIYNLLDNIIGYDDDIVTPGERLGAGVQGFASGLLSDPLGTGADIVRGGYETIERAMAPGATPMDVLGAAGMAMGAGGMAARPAGSVGMGGRTPRASNFEGMTREEFLGSPRITRPSNAASLRPRALVGFDEVEADEFPVGNLTARYTEDGAAVYDGDRVVASYNFGDTLVVDPRYRRQGIGEELVYQWRTRFPAPGAARDRTRVSQRIQESVWDRIQREMRDDTDLSANRSTTTGLLASAASETPAQQVARLLREGRADEVTDDLMAQADPQEMFRLYEAGETGADMPMDEASRMARAQEMGLADDQYHATTANFPAFMPSQTGLAGRGVYTGDFATDVTDYARAYGAEGLNVIPVRTPPEASYARRIDWQNTVDADPDFPYDATVDETVAGFARAADRMSGQGYSGVLSQPGERVTFNPENIRSRFARFDPRLSHLANLNAANIDPLTGAVAMGASQQQNTDPLANLRAYIAQYGGVLGR